MNEKPTIYEAIVVNRLSKGYVLVDNTGDRPRAVAVVDPGLLMREISQIVDGIEAPGINVDTEDLGSNVRSITGRPIPRNIRESMEETPTDEPPALG